MVAGQSKGLPVRHARARDRAVSTIGAGPVCNRNRVPDGDRQRRPLGTGGRLATPALSGWPGEPAAAPLQQRREERPRPQLGDPQLQIPRRARQHAGPVPVRPPAGSGHQPRRPSMHPEPQAVQTGPGPSCVCPSARTIGVVSLTITLWPLRCAPGTPSRPVTYTTGRDATAVSSPRSPPAATANMKLARALNPPAAHGNTLVMRSSAKALFVAVLAG
jgi:hypothetical protein